VQELCVRVLGLAPELAVEWLPRSDTRAAALATLIAHLSAPNTGMSETEGGLAALTTSDDAQLAAASMWLNELGGRNGHRPMSDSTLARYLMAVAQLRGVSTRNYGSSLVRWLRQHAHFMSGAGNIIGSAEAALDAIAVRSIRDASLSQTATGLASPLCRLLLACAVVEAASAGKLPPLVSRQIQ
jgi:hypothetical protein